MRNALRDAACVLLLLFCAMAAYGNTLEVPFIFDDVNNIVLNDAIRGFFPAHRFFQSPFSFAGRPLTTFTFALNYGSTGLDLRAFHLVNLLIHFLAGLAVFGTARQCLATPAL